MPKPTLTPANVATKQVALYALPNYDLFMEADAIESNFKEWIEANFDLTLDQASYLGGMNAAASSNYGQQCALCFRYRLEIILDYPAPPPLSLGKWLEKKDNIVVKANGSGGIDVTGDMTFTIVYEV